MLHGLIGVVIDRDYFPTIGGALDDWQIERTDDGAIEDWSTRVWVEISSARYFGKKLLHGRYRIFSTRKERYHRYHDVTAVM